MFCCDFLWNWCTNEFLDSLYCRFISVIFYSIIYMILCLSLTLHFVVDTINFVYCFNNVNFLFMKSVIILLVLLFMFSINSKLLAQEKTPVKKAINNHEIGFAAGATTGLGMSYRQKFNKYGFQVTFLPIYNDKNDNRLNVGVTFMYYLFEAEKSKLFLYQGNHYFHERSLDWDGENFDREVSCTDDGFNNGIGVGIELILFKRVGLNFMGGYAFYDNFSSLNMTGETGLYYMF